VSLVSSVSSFQSCKCVIDTDSQRAKEAVGQIEGKIEKENPRA